MECRVMPASHAIGVGTVLEQKREPLVVVPVGLAKEHSGKTLAVKFAAPHEDPQCGVVIGLRYVVWGLLIIRVSTAYEQQTGQLRVLSDSCGAVDSALPFRTRLVIVLIPPGIRAGSSVKQGCCC